MKIVVTAGPTREMIDDVRYLSNASSGRTGFAVAAAAVRAGHETVLVSGPVALAVPAGARLVAVTSARDMQAAVAAEWDDLDALVMTAAVSDYRPAARASGKLKKTADSLTLELVRNPDILALAGARKEHRVLVGFALEVQDAEDNARKKLEAKNLDLLVLNGPENLDSERSRFSLWSDAGREEELQLEKSELGALLVRRCEELVARRSGA